MERTTVLGSILFVTAAGKEILRLDEEIAALEKSNQKIAANLEARIAAITAEANLQIARNNEQIDLKNAEIDALQKRNERVSEYARLASL